MRMRSLVHIQTLFRFRSTNSCVSDYAICTHSTKPQTLTVYLAQTKLQVVFFSFYVFCVRVFCFVFLFHSFHCCRLLAAAASCLFVCEVRATSADHFYCVCGKNIHCSPHSSCVKSNRERKLRRVESTEFGSCVFSANRA